MLSIFVPFKVQTNQSFSKVNLGGQLKEVLERSGAVQHARRDPRIHHAAVLVQGAVQDPARKGPPPPPACAGVARSLASRPPRAHGGVVGSMLWSTESK